MESKKITRLLNKILQEIFVDKYNCIVCDRELNGPSAYGLCEGCKSKLQFVEDRICKKCGRLQLNEADYCLTCQAHKREFDYARSCVTYEDIAKQVVKGIKFGGKKYYAKYIAKFLIDKYLTAFNEVDIDLVIPVPLTKSTKRERGFNQSWEIAKRFADAVELVADDSVVAKVKDTEEQAKLGGKEREENILGAFEVMQADAVKDKSVLIIDDVMTTGSTASEIARILKKAKAKNVYLLTFASTKFKLEESNQSASNK